MISQVGMPQGGTLISSQFNEEPKRKLSQNKNIINCLYKGEEPNIKPGLGTTSKHGKHKILKLTADNKKK